MTLGENIKTFRKHHNITQKGLAKELEMSERMIQKYESNEVEPSLKVIDKIAVVLGVTVSDLIENKRIAIKEINLKDIPTKELLEELLRRQILKIESEEI